MSRTIKVIKAGQQTTSTVEEVRQAAFKRLDDKAAERQAAERIKQWIYECRSNKLIAEATAREFWKLH